ncbi:MAG: carbohydrate binding domain-containing protein [Prevotella sp.]|nr:carbohydrate binding domain-containing protein [Prevotella sp.]
MQVVTAFAQQDSIFIYSPNERQGLHIAVNNGNGWQHLGQLCSSDYGPWGAEKRMYHPSLCRAKDGSWRLVFQVNDRSPLFAAAYSKDLITWRPQDYPRVSTRQCLAPVIRPMDSGFNIYFKSETGIRRIFASGDFRQFSNEMAFPLADTSLWQRNTITLEGKQLEGQTFAVSTNEITSLRQHFAWQAEDSRISAERMHDDTQNLGNLPKTITATLNVDMTQQKVISDKLIGIFFEDISYAADGGLYAELIQNRDFEYSRKDRGEWNATTAWHSTTPITIAEDNPLSKQNPHHAIINNDSLWNEGWDGIAVEQGKKYDFSIFVRGKKKIEVQICTASGTTIAKATIKANKDNWQQYTATMTASQTDAQARLLLVPLGGQQAAIDMVSLFPQETFMNRKNGLRKDLAQVIADLHPKFVRFPGGCMTHGQGLDNIYHWHHTIGALEERVPDFNIWHYHQTRGLGFFEYFQFCEDIGAEPLPVLAAGVPCQNSAANNEGMAGQQGGIPMEELPAYIDELCNLIDWANADPASNEWARKRAEAGHPAPFNLKYLGIGNEDIISTVFEERYEAICKALRQRHPEIKICGTVGPFHTPSADYIEGWDFTRKHPDYQYMTDEHYYESTGWFMHHRDYYDNYPRTMADGTPATKVYLGEWAASTRVKRPNLETALAEALYLTDIERNGDIVEMTSYAPMLCKDRHSNWDPDMIYFSNTEVRTTPAYEVQQLFSTSCGDHWVMTQFADLQAQLSHRVGASLVVDSKTGKRYLKLVNALPATLDLKINGIDIPASVNCQQMTGNNVEDRHAKTETITTDSPTALPPYSIRIIQL